MATKSYTICFVFLINVLQSGKLAVILKIGLFVISSNQLMQVNIALTF